MMGTLPHFSHTYAAQVRRAGWRIRTQEACPDTPYIAHVVRRISRIPAIAAPGQRDGRVSTALAARRCRAGAGASSGPRLIIAAADRLRLSGRLCSTFQWLSTKPG